MGARVLARARRAKLYDIAEKLMTGMYTNSI